MGAVGFPPLVLCLRGGLLLKDFLTGAGLDDLLLLFYLEIGQRHRLLLKLRLGNSSFLVCERVLGATLVQVLVNHSWRCAQVQI